MKTTIFVLICVVFLTGCMKFGIREGDQSVPILVKMSAREIGCEVATINDPEIDRAVRNVYKLAKTGELTQDGIDQLTDLVSERVSSRPTLIANIADLVALVGVHFDAGGYPTDLNVVPPEVFTAAETGYLSGIRLCGGAQ